MPGAGSGSGVQAQWLRLVGHDPSRTAQRFELKATGKRLTLEGLFQESDARLAGDRTLSAADRALVGNSWGSQRQSLTAGYGLGSAGTLAGSWLRLGDSKGALSRQRLSWQGARGARIALDFGQADAAFNRLADLPEAERSDVKGRQGQRWQDLSARFALASWLSTEQLWSHRRSLAEDRGEERTRGQWTLLPVRGATVTWLREATKTETGKQASTTTLNSFKWEQKLPSLTLQWGRDATVKRGGERSTRKVGQALRLEQKLSFLTWSAALDTMRTGESDATRRLALRLSLPAAPAKAPARLLSGTMEVTTVRSPGDRVERLGKLDLATRLPLLSALKLDGKWQNAGREESEQWKLEMRGQLSARLPWSGTLAQNRSDRAGGRRDLTLTFQPPAAKFSRLSFWLARSEALSPRGSDERAAPPAQAAMLMHERTLGPVALAIGLAQAEAGGEDRFALAYDVHSDPKRLVQWELSHRLVQAGKAASPLLRREALTLRPTGGWQISLARERLTTPTADGLDAGEARLVGELARKTSGWQWSMGAAHQMGGDGRRAGLATRFSLQGAPLPGGTLQLAYEGYPAQPGPDRLRERLTAAYKHRLGAALSLDFQGTWLRRHGKPDSEPTWRLDLAANF
jgi:hypothetical protein